MAEPRTTAKHRSAVTGWLPHSGNSSWLVWIGFAMALVAAAVVVWSALGNPNNFAERTDWITHTQNVLEVLRVAKADAFFGVAAVQEYYRTGDLKQLEGLPGDFFWLQHQLAALRTLTSDNPAEQGRVEHLDRLINRLVTLSRQLTLMARTHSVTQVAAEPDSAELSGGFGEVTRILREMTADEDRLMTLRTEAVRATSRRSVAAITTGSVVILWLLILGFHAIRLSARARGSAEDLGASREKLQKLNATLEQRVTERTAALLEQTSLVSSIFQSVPEAMMTRTTEGIITSWNPGAERLFGYTAAEIIGRSARVLMPAGEHWLFDPRTDSDKRRATQTSEAKRLRKDGTVLEVVVTVAAIRPVGGQVAGYAVIYHDNAQSKRAQAEMQAARDLALEAVRVRSEFLTTVSHEVRTPLNAIIGLTELLLLSDLSPVQHQQADQVRSSGELLLTIVKDILDFSKLDAGKVALEKVRFSLDHLVEETIHDFVPTAAHKGIELALFVAPEITGNLRGDPNRLRQILNNLLSNAVKFTRQGEVSLSVAKAQEIGNDVLLSFEVRDSGIGIPREDQGRLFQPFVQADSSTARKYGGTGLGLVIAASLVKQMGGEIGFESESAKGSTFHFTARLGRDIAETGAAKLTLGEESFAGTRAIVVTPSATNRRMLSEHLSLWGISNMSMNTAAGALKELREATARGGPFHLALVEATLVEVGGPTLIEEIKRGRHHRQADQAVAIAQLSDGALAGESAGRDSAARARQARDNRDGEPGCAQIRRRAGGRRQPGEFLTRPDSTGEARLFGGDCQRRLWRARSGCAQALRHHPDGLRNAGHGRLLGHRRNQTARKFRPPCDHNRDDCPCDGEHAGALSGLRHGRLSRQAGKAAAARRDAGSMGVRRIRRQTNRGDAGCAVGRTGAGACAAGQTWQQLSKERVRSLDDQGTAFAFEHTGRGRVS